jgi:hypothetical protein
MCKGIAGYTQVCKETWSSGYTLPNLDDINVVVKDGDREARRQEFDSYLQGSGDGA